MISLTNYDSSLEKSPQEELLHWAVPRADHRPPRPGNWRRLPFGNNKGPTFGDGFHGGFHGGFQWFTLVYICLHGGVLKWGDTPF